MPKALSNDLRERIIAHRAEGKTIADITQCLRISTRTVSRIIKKHQDTASVSAGQSSRRPRLTTPNQDEQLRAASRANPFATTSSHRMAMELNVSTNTVKRRLREGKLYGRKAAKKENLTLGNQIDKLGFAYAYQE
ncbi:uncharacterized protein LOC111622701 [Centruroides sculpturatus]|uniref:uncharacterized protein LOC111622701 n=1 Tax=Centruroides sculpturatus TaxID=218467 RepID=UPI000C6CA914|nr:uncharacterized protein LOC111622701 [Centruroides sculpturatus]